MHQDKELKVLQKGWETSELSAAGENQSSHVLAKHSSFENQALSVLFLNIYMSAVQSRKGTGHCEEMQVLVSLCCL